MKSSLFHPGAIAGASEAAKYYEEQQEYPEKRFGKYIS